MPSPTLIPVDERGHRTSVRLGRDVQGRGRQQALSRARATPARLGRIPPRQVRLDELVTTKRTLDLGHLLAEDSTFYGDLFAHVVEWQGELYLEDGLHRALRAALQQRHVLHARVLPLET